MDQKHYRNRAAVEALTLAKQREAEAILKAQINAAQDATSIIDKRKPSKPFVDFYKQVLIYLINLLWVKVYRKEIDHLKEERKRQFLSQSELFTSETAAGEGNKPEPKPVIPDQADGYNPEASIYQSEIPKKSVYRNDDDGLYYELKNIDANWEPNRRRINIVPPEILRHEFCKERTCHVDFFYQKINPEVQILKKLFCQENYSKYLKTAREYNEVVNKYFKDWDEYIKKNDPIKAPKPKLEKFDEISVSIPLNIDYKSAQPENHQKDNKTKFEKMLPEWEKLYSGMNTHSNYPNYVLAIYIYILLTVISKEVDDTELKSLTDHDVKEYIHFARHRNNQQLSDKIEDQEENLKARLDATRATFCSICTRRTVIEDKLTKKRDILVKMTPKSLWKGIKSPRETDTFKFLKTFLYYYYYRHNTNLASIKPGSQAYGLKFPALSDKLNVADHSPVAPVAKVQQEESAKPEKPAKPSYAAKLTGATSSPRPEAPLENIPKSILSHDEPPETEQDHTQLSEANEFNIEKGNKNIKSVLTPEDGKGLELDYLKLKTNPIKLPTLKYFKWINFQIQKTENTCQKIIDIFTFESAKEEVRHLGLYFSAMRLYVDLKSFILVAELQPSFPKAQFNRYFINKTKQARKDAIEYWTSMMELIETYFDTTFQLRDVETKLPRTQTNKMKNILSKKKIFARGEELDERLITKEEHFKIALDILLSHYIPLTAGQSVTKPPTELSERDQEILKKIFNIEEKTSTWERETPTRTIFNGLVLNYGVRGGLDETLKHETKTFQEVFLIKLDNLNNTFSDHSTTITNLTKEIDQVEKPYLMFEKILSIMDQPENNKSKLFLIELGKYFTESLNKETFRHLTKICPVNSFCEICYKTDFFAQAFHQNKIVNISWIGTNDSKAAQFIKRNPIPYHRAFTKDCPYMKNKPTDANLSKVITEKEEKMADEKPMPDDEQIAAEVDAALAARVTGGKEEEENTEAPKKPVLDVFVLLEKKIDLLVTKEETQQIIEALTDLIPKRGNPKLRDRIKYKLKKLAGHLKSFNESQGGGTQKKPKFSKHSKLNSNPKRTHKKKNKIRKNKTQKKAKKSSKK